MSSESLVAFGVNEYTPALRFLASLSDGRTVIQDDRPGEPHAWHRLKDFLKANPGLAITCLRLQAPHGFDMPTPPNQKGYVFGYASGVLLGAGSISKVGIGFYDGTTCLIQWYERNTMQPVNAEQQTTEQCGFKLILNP